MVGKKVLRRNGKLLSLFAAGKTLPGFKLQVYGYHSLASGNRAVPADAYLVLSKLTRSRPYVFVEVSRIKIQAVNLIFRILSVRSADLPQEGESKPDIPGQYEEFPFESACRLVISDNFTHLLGMYSFL